MINILTAFLFLFSSSPVLADSENNELKSFKVIVKENGKRQPSSTCLPANNVDGETILMVYDYAKCSPAEIAAIKNILLEMLKRQVSKPLSENPMNRLSTIGSIGAIRSSLAMIKALGL